MSILTSIKKLFKHESKNPNTIDSDNYKVTIELKETPYVKKEKKIEHNFWSSSNKCYNCWSPVEWIELPWKCYKKKCTNCWTMNYKVRVYTDDHNIKVWKAWTEEEAKESKEQWDIYHHDIYPRRKMKEEFWEDLVSHMENVLKERLWRRANAEELEIELRKEYIEKILNSNSNRLDSREIWNNLNIIMWLYGRLWQNENMLHTFILMLYYDQFHIYWEQYIREKLHTEEKIKIKLNDFDSICSNTLWNIEAFLSDFEKEWISRERIKKEFDIYASSHPYEWKLKELQRNILIIKWIVYAVLWIK